MMKTVLDIAVLGIASGTGSSGFPVIAVVLVAVAVLLLLIFLTGYVKAPPDTAMIISGLRKNPQGAHRKGRYQDSLSGEKG